MRGTEQETTRKLKQKAVRTAGALLVGAAGVLGTGQQPPSIEAQVPPTPVTTAVTPPTPTELNPADAAATSTARQDEAFGREKARLETEYYRTHPSPTPAPVPTAVSTAPRSTEQNQGGLPGILWAAIGAAGAATYGSRKKIFAQSFRKGIGNFINTNWERVKGSFARRPGAGGTGAGGGAAGTS